MQPLVSIITINYNAWETTRQLLRSIESHDYDSIEVIVVDNNSKFNPQQAIRTEFPNYKFIRSDVNLGFSGGNNLGIQAAKGEYLFLLNNDTLLTDGTVSRLVELFKFFPNMGAASPLLCYFPKEGQKDIIQYAGTTRVHPYTGRNQTIGEGAIDFGQFDKALPTAYCHGAAMMVKKSVIEQVGPMPVSFFLYYEELDWCDRMRKAGFDLYIQPNAKVYHDESQTVGSESALKTYYLNRNRFFFIRRNYKWQESLIFALFYTFVTLPKESAKFVLKGKFKNLTAIWKAYFWNLFSVISKKNNKTDLLNFTPLPISNKNEKLASEVY